MWQYLDSCSLSICHTFSVCTTAWREAARGLFQLLHPLHFTCQTCPSHLPPSTEGVNLFREGVKRIAGLCVFGCEVFYYIWNNCYMVQNDSTVLPVLSISLQNLNLFYSILSLTQKMSLGGDVACSESSTQPCSFLELFSLFNSLMRLYFTSIHRTLQQNSLRGKLYSF